MKELPKVTLFVYAYNHAEFIGEAIDAALAQTYKNLEIILSDDNSADDTYKIMRRKYVTYRGPHKIILNQNKTNLGISEHLNKIMTLGSGEWFVLSAGDDISFPNRVKMIMDKITENPEILSINTAFNIIDQNGKVIRFNGFDNNRLYVTGATGAWSRKIFDVFGPITQPTSAEDVVIPFRAILLGKLSLLNCATIFYREHFNSVSNPSLKTNLEAQKHLKKINSQLINACEQRLLDLNIVKNQIPEFHYLSLKKKHQAIIANLHKRNESIEKTIFLQENSISEKIKYLFTSSSLNKHDTFIYRLKQVLLTNAFIASTTSKLKLLSSARTSETIGNHMLIDIVELDRQKDLLIYL